MRTESFAVSHTTLICINCQRREKQLPKLPVCEACGSPLQTHYDRSVFTPSPQSDSTGIWQHTKHLPIHNFANIVSMGEGNTPCVQLKNLGNELGLSHLYAKVEYMSPTGSFKDRGTTVLVSAAKEAGIQELVEDSSGNAGASMAAYCAKAGIHAIVFVPSSTPIEKTNQIRYYGAAIRPIAGTREEAARAAHTYALESGIFYGSHNLNPYFVDGMKSFAYELANAPTPRPIKHVVIPVGNGSLLIGSSIGFSDLTHSENTQPTPRLHCVQSQAYMPITATIRMEACPTASPGKTLASGIAVSHPPRARQVVEAIQSSNGTAVAVADKDIARWHIMLASKEGLFVEPTTAAAIAGLEILVLQGTIQPDDVTLVPLTGSGLKHPASEHPMNYI